VVLKSILKKFKTNLFNNLTKILWLPKKVQKRKVEERNANLFIFNLKTMINNSTRKNSLTARTGSMRPGMKSSTVRPGVRPGIVKKVANTAGKIMSGAKKLATKGVMKNTVKKMANTMTGRMK